MAHATAHFLGSPAPWGLWKESKVKYHYISITKSISFFLNQTLCVFSQMKDIKHIRRDFHWAPCVMPKGLGLGGTGVKNLIFLTNMVMWHIKLKGTNSSPGYTKYFTLQSN